MGITYQLIYFQLSNGCEGVLGGNVSWKLISGTKVMNYKFLILHILLCYLYNSIILHGMGEETGTYTFIVITIYYLHPHSISSLLGLTLSSHEIH